MLLEKIKAAILGFRKPKVDGQATGVSDPSAEVVLRNFNMLSLEEQNVVVARVRELKTAEYETVLKYGEDVSSKVNMLITVMIDAFAEAGTFTYGKKNSKQFIRAVVDAKILFGRLHAFMSALMAIRIESELRVLAVERVFGDYKKARYEFLGALGASGALKKLRMRRALENVYIELKTTIRLIDVQVGAIANAIRSDENLIKSANLSLLVDTYSEEHDWLFSYLHEKVETVSKDYGIVFEEEGCEIALKDSLHMIAFGGAEVRPYAEKKIIAQLATWQYKLDLYGYLHMSDYVDLFKRIDEMKSLRYDCRNIKLELGRWSWINGERFVNGVAPESIGAIYRELRRFETGCKRYIDLDIKREIECKKKMLNAMYYLWTNNPLDDCYSPRESAKNSFYWEARDLYDMLIKRIENEYDTDADRVSGPEPDPHDSVATGADCRLSLLCLACVCKTPCLADDDRRKDCTNRNGTCAKRNLMIVNIHETIYDNRAYLGALGRAVLSKLEVEVEK